MKVVATLLIVLLVIACIFFFTKPSDETMRAEALKIVSGSLVKIPGYSDPNANNNLPTTPESDKIVIKDHLLWKDVSYIYPSSVQKLGNGYLTAFHSTKSPNP